jgi:molybdenum cofactor biosynthesis enzyme MoaA
MDNRDLLKCVYCDHRSSDEEERKRHLKKEHYEKMVEIAKKSNQTIDWAAGYTAAFFTKDNPES